MSAIRTFTVDNDNGTKPNGPAEAALVALLVALDPDAWPDDPRTMARLRVANQAGMDFARESAAQTKALRIAAEHFFGGDFRKAVPHG